MFVESEICGDMFVAPANDAKNKTIQLNAPSLGLLQFDTRVPEIRASIPLKKINRNSKSIKKREKTSKYTKNFPNDHSTQNVIENNTDLPQNCDDNSNQSNTDQIIPLTEINLNNTIENKIDLKKTKKNSCQEKTINTNPNGPCLRRSNRIRKRGQKQTHEKSPIKRNGKLNIENMPSNDHGYQQQTEPVANGTSATTTTTTNGIGKYGNNRNHLGNTNDMHFGNGNDSLSYRQQLNETASSMASLCNIGNSCYMNSVIYTLRFTPMFIHSLHHLVNGFTMIFNRKDNLIKLKSASLGRNVNGLQGQNARSHSSKDLVSLGASSPSQDLQKTSQQKAAEKLHDLFQCLCNNEINETNEPYQADNLLKAIQDVNPIFEGNQQQDAHEFLMCILDSIRESCQTLIKTLYDNPDIISNLSNGLTEHTEQQIVKPPTIAQPILSKFFSRKSKTQRIGSPSKEISGVTDTSSGSITTINSANAIINGCSTTDSPSELSQQVIQEKISALDLDFFSEYFEGTTTSSTVCLNCETTTEQEVKMIDLSVPIENADPDNLDDSFIQKLCVTSDRFQGDNKFRCENCMGYTEAMLQISYPKLPRLLVIQLKRFSGGMEKINSYIPTPFTLQCFCKTCYKNENAPKEHEYNLYSVITHVGATMCAGHYIAYTTSLNVNSTYINCPKDITRKDQLNSVTTNQSDGTSIGNQQSSTSSTSTSSTTAAGVVSPTLNTKNSVGISSVKKLISRKRNTSNSASTSNANASANSSSSSASDTGKNQKNVNGIKSITNGVSNVQLGNNITSSTTSPTSTLASSTIAKTTTLCSSINCCNIRMKTLQNLENTSTSTINSSNGGNLTISNGHDYQSHSRNNSLSSVYSDQYVQVNLNNKNSEQIWYMCDDDKIKAIPQHHFREMLQPNKKNMITPYLLFYARNDIFQTPH